MGTEVLRPQTCFIERIHASPPALNQSRRKNLAGNRRRRRPDARSGSFDDRVGGDCHVTVLRRGQSIGDLKKVSLSPSRPDVYAGSTVTLSPSPRALPFPSFFSKQSVHTVSDDSATRVLRRLLRLE